MNNKSLKALALVAVFGFSIAGAAVQFVPEKAPESKKIEKITIGPRLQTAKKNGLI